LENQEGIQPHTHITPDTRTPPPADQAPEPEPEQTMGQWFAQNGVTLAIVLTLLVYLFFKFDSEGLLAIAKAALGLSFVIFIHELGHFLVAKWCDVHVTTFSIGFGPAIPGCRFQWGETTYKLALFPLGGYVQMVGQVDGDEASDGSEDDPRSYRNKSVWQRMAIISAGVVMNVILAIVCFMVVFQGPGKDREASVVSAVDTGAPAFTRGLRTGAVILQIGDVKNPYFLRDLTPMVMASQEGETLTLVTKRPTDEQATVVHVEPRKNEDDERAMIGISPSSALRLASRRQVAREFSRPVEPGSAADKATPSFAFDDEIVATTDAEQDLAPDKYDPRKLKPLPADPRKEEGDQRDYFEYRRRMQVLAGKEVVIQVQRRGGSAKVKETADLKVPPAFHRTLGLRMVMGQITAIREGSPAAKAGLQIKDKKRQNPEGDLIQSVEVRSTDGKPLRFEEAKLDPIRLPTELRGWAKEILAAKPNADKDDLKVTMKLRRNVPEPGKQYDVVTVELTWDPGWEFDRAIPFGEASPWAIPELGLAYQVRTTVAGVEPDSAAAKSGLQAGDLIKKIRFSYTTSDNGEKKEGPWLDLEVKDKDTKEWKEADYWAYAFQFLQAARLTTEVALKVQRSKEVKEYTLEATEDRTWPLVERGVVLTSDKRVQKAENIFHAVALGLEDTHASMMQVFQSIRGMVTGRISPKNLGGPVTIARVAYRFAGYDFWEFVFFLGLISVNLAVINFLPIPVLDGGHMVFLLYEKIRGKPASETVRVGATYAGLALILCLMVFVLYLDFTRLF
jgi:regulator of sigma E protease